MIVLFLIHFASTWFMTGVIWIVQIVHYPLFRHVDAKEFKKYEASHTSLIGFIVVPAMLFEITSGIYILFSDFLSGEQYLLFLVASILLLVIWLSTMLIQARQHRVLSSGYNLAIINSLVKYNWIRTIGWTLRAVILTFILIGYIKNAV